MNEKFICQGCSKLLEMSHYDVKKNGTYYKRCKSCRMYHSNRERKQYKKKTDNLYNTHPELRTEWNEEKNGSMQNYTYGSSKKVSWICRNGGCDTTGKPHEWETTIGHRTNKDKRGCPFCSNRKLCPCGCNSLASNLELKCEWNEEKNGNMKLYAPSSGKKVSWICQKGTCDTTGKPHEWMCMIIHRTGKNKTNCPYCSIPCKKLCICGCNSLASNSVLKCEWNEEKNGSMKNYTYGSSKKVSWICQKGRCDTTGKPHEWKSIIYSRIGKNTADCPFCSNQKLCPCGCNSLTSNLELKCEWNEEKNGNMKLYAPSSNKKVWWICQEKYKTTGKPHEWQSTISSRTSRNKTGCPFCRSSKMEKKITEVCEQNHIEHQPQKEHTINKRKLKFDHYFPQYNAYVECQGQQHFHSDSYYSKKNNFSDSLRKDYSKVKFAFENSFSFLSISYMTSLEAFRPILLDFIERCKISTVYRLYYDENHFWEVCGGSRIEPIFEDSEECVEEVRDVYRLQFESLEEGVYVHVPMSE